MVVVSNSESPFGGLPRVDFLPLSLSFRSLLTVHPPEIFFGLISLFIPSFPNV